LLSQPVEFIEVDLQLLATGVALPLGRII